MPVPLAAAPAVPPAAEVTDATTLSAPHALRRGLVVGLELGAGVAGASGYPNNITEIGDPNYYSASGWMGGSSSSLFVMGALTDYLNVGFFFSSGMFRNGEWRSSGVGGGLRLETFPLTVVFPDVAWLGGVGALAQFGVGSGTLTATSPTLAGAPPAQGTSSFGDVGVLYEWGFGHLFGGHFAAGPALEYQAIWSRPFERHGLVGSARLAFYGGP